MPKIFAILFLVSALALGCSSFLHAVGPVQSVVCGVASAVLPELEAQAQRCGPAAPECLALLESTYESACGTALQNGASADDARAAGRAAVSRAGVKMRAARPEAP